MHAPNITQKDVAEFENLRADLREAQRSFLLKRSEIMESLARGADCEPGPYRILLRVAARLIVE